MSRSHNTLPPSEDPFGSALLDYLIGKKNLFIRVHSDATSEDHIDVRYLFREYSKWPLLEKKAIALCKGKILELGGGAGSHALFLQEKGMDITSMDFSPGAVEVMRSRGVKNVVFDSYLNPPKQKYDTILMLMNGIGLVGSIKNLKDFLRRSFEKNLNPNGQILFDSSDLVYLLSDPGSSVKEIGKERYYGEITYRMEYNKMMGPKFSWLFIDFKTLSQLCSELGLKAKKIYEDDHYAYLVSVQKEIL